MRKTTKKTKVFAYREWDWLPSDLLFLIFSLLPLKDLIRTSAVCKNWLRSAADYNGWKDQLPWLRVTLGGKFYSLSDRCFYKLKLPPDIRVGTSLPSYQEWMVVKLKVKDDSIADEYEIFLYNPFSLTRIKLPPLGQADCHAVHLSSSPLSPGCMAVAIMSHKGCWRLRVCMVDGSKGWRTLSQVKEYNEAIFYRKYLLVLNENGALFVADSNNGVFKQMIPAPADVPVPTNVHEMVFKHPYFTLMIYGDELLMMSYFHACHDYVSVKVYKADFERSIWVTARSLKGSSLHSVSVSIGPSISYIADDCVYFTNDKKFQSFRVSNQQSITHCSDHTSPIWSPFDGRKFSFLTPKATFPSIGS